MDRDREGMAPYMKRTRNYSLLVLLLLASLPLYAQQQPQQPPQPPSPEGKEGTFYLGVMGSNFRHRSVGSRNERGNTPGFGAMFGRFLTDHIKFEIRGGTSEEELIRPNLAVEIDYYASAYIGLSYDWSMFSRVYGQFGMSYVETSARGSALGEFPLADIDEEYISQDFGSSFLFGLDLDFLGNSVLFLEYGRLHKGDATSTESGIQIWQSHAGIRYDF